jgi:hypothetical protein
MLTKQVQFGRLEKYPGSSMRSIKNSLRRRRARMAMMAGES